MICRTVQLSPVVPAARAMAEAEEVPWAKRLFEIAGNVFAVTGRTEREYRRSLAGVRERLVFYGSTPAYRAVPKHHGWDALQEELRTLSLRGRWKEMGWFVDDDVSNAFAVVAEDSATAGQLIRERYTDVYHRVSISPAPNSDPALALAILDGIRSD
ncbi:LLM class flavin-dependent oxidoreductase [Streptomyces sp. SID3343]|nr:LLM class flavin-dependent oxidoreductase [Streptomyces sp. SID3343]